MSEQLVINTSRNRPQENQGLNWSRITGYAFVIALHVTAFMMLLIPAVAPKPAPEPEKPINVLIVDAKPPPPPPPPPPPDPIKPPPQIQKAVAKPTTVQLPPPPEAPPVVVDAPPRPMDVAVQPTPPAPPAPPADVKPGVDIGSKKMNPPKYPPAAVRAGITGTVILIVDVDANGSVTNVSVEKSSRNRDLDRAAMDAARGWKFTPAVVNGEKAAGRVRVPVDFTL